MEFFAIISNNFAITDSIPTLTYFAAKTIFCTYPNIEFNDETIIVNLKALDKITAKTSTLSIKLGEEKYFGNLKIKPLKCVSSELDQAPDTIAYLQVIDISMEDNNQVFVFNGWTFASSPTLRSLDHAIYDLWLQSCSNI